MKNHVKHHINVITIVLLMAVLAIAIICIDFIIAAINIIQSSDVMVVNEFLLNYFSLLDDDIDLSNNNWLGIRYFFDIKWFAIGFIIAYLALFIYLMKGTVRLYKCLLKIRKDELFYNEQGEEFRKVGATIIIFAKLKYILFCFTGIMSFGDITVFIKEIPAFLILYLFGKFILIMSYITERGELIKEENELTI